MSPPRPPVDALAVACASAAWALTRLPDTLADGGLAPLVVAVGASMWLRLPAPAGSPLRWEAPARRALWAMTAAALTAPWLSTAGPAAQIGALAALVALAPRLPSAGLGAATLLLLGGLAPAWQAAGSPWTLLTPRWDNVSSWWAVAAPLAILWPGALAATWVEAAEPGPPARRRRRDAAAIVLWALAAMGVAAAWQPADTLPAHPSLPAVSVAALGAAAWPAAASGGLLLPGLALLWLMGPGAPAAGWWLEAGAPLLVAALLGARAARTPAKTRLAWLTAWAPAALLSLAGVSAWSAPTGVTEALQTGGTAVALAWWVAWTALRSPP